MIFLFWNYQNMTLKKREKEILKDPTFHTKELNIRSQELAFYSVLEFLQMSPGQVAPLVNIGRSLDSHRVYLVSAQCHLTCLERGNPSDLLQTTL